MIREAFVTIGDRRVRYLEAGSGAPVVLLHGFPLSAEMWRPQLERPPAGWRLIAPDLRGFGGAPLAETGRPTTIDDYAADVTATLDALEIDRAVIGGLSMGGYVTLALLRQSPQRVRGLVLADTRAGADSAEGREGRRTMLDLVRQKGPAAVADQMLPKLLGTTTTRERPEIAEHVRRLIEASSPPAIAAAIEAMLGRPDSTADLARVSCPTIILVGEEDVLTPPSESEGMQRLIAGSRLVRLSGAGHLSNLEAPDLFSAALAGFLATAAL